MAEITAAMVKELREKTDAPMMECKKALTEADGDLAKAEEILRVKLGSKASKAAARVTAEGIVALHIAGNRASMVEVNCETDFVLIDLVGGDDNLGRDLAMHIAASKPKSLDSSGVDPSIIETERRIATEKAAESGKPAEIIAKMVEGSVQKYLKEVTLLGQVFVKAEDGKQTIEQLLKARGASIASFALYIVGEGIEKKANDFAAEVAAQAAAARAA